jgi:hypothetical protein
MAHRRSLVSGSGETKDRTFLRTSVDWMPDSLGVAVFAMNHKSTLFLVVRANEERITLATTRGPPNDLHLVYQGERDGCD